MRLLSLVLLSGLACSAWAQTLPENFPALSQVAGHVVSTLAPQSVTQLLLPLSKARQLSGQLAVEQSLQVTGEQQAVTYELTVQQAPLEAFNEATKALQEQSATLLYRCEGRDCGSSNLWANSVFKESKLFGVDDQQAYAVLRLKRESAEQLISLYAITRGNRRAYLHIQTLAPSQSLGVILPSAATLTYQLRTQEHVQFAELTHEPDADWVALLASSLKRQTTLRVAISGKYAGMWRDALIAKGIAAGRLELDEPTTLGLTLQRIR